MTVSNVRIGQFSAQRKKQKIKQLNTKKGNGESFASWRGRGLLDKLILLGRMLENF